MQITAKNVQDFFFFFFAQAFSYALVSWNFRAIAQVWYGSIIISDMLISAYGFIMTKKIVEEKSRSGFVGYTLGGACGTLLSVYLTKHFFGS